MTKLFTPDQTAAMQRIIEDYETYMFPDEIIDIAYQLTAYENYGFVTRENLRELIINEYLNTDLQIDAYNEYCENNSYYDDMLYPMDLFNEIMNGKEPWEIARACYYGDFKPCDDYFGFNGYGNLVSYSDYEIEHNVISQNELKEYFIKNDNLYYFPADETEIIENAQHDSDCIIAVCEYLLKEGF